MSSLVTLNSLSHFVVDNCLGSSLGACHMVPTFGIATAKYERPVEAAQDARKTLTRSGGKVPTQTSDPE